MRKYSCCTIIKQALFMLSLTHSPAGVYAYLFLGFKFSKRCSAEYRVGGMQLLLNPLPFLFQSVILKNFGLNLKESVCQSQTDIRLNY